MIKWIKTTQLFPGIGQFNTLIIKRLIDHGAILDAAGQDVLLPKKFVTESMKANTEVAVFIYTDSEDRPVATTQKPMGILDSFVALKVVDRAPFGAFMDWGLDKHLLVPNSEMEVSMIVGETYVVKIVLDHRTNRLIGVNKLSVFLKPASDLDTWQPVDSLIIKKTPLGYKAVVNNMFEGLFFQNEVFSPIHIGDKLVSYVKNIRHDGKIDLVLKLPGKAGTESDTDIVLASLKENNGMLNLGDHSDPEEISRILSMSKKSFKRAIGTLYKKRIIKIEADRIELVC